jgi:DNA modification methylase
VTLHHGDCLDVMAAMPAESVDAVVTDPPYGLGFMGKGWDRLDTPTWQGGHDAAPITNGPFGGGGHRVRHGPGGPAVTAFHQQWAEAAYRVAKPSAYLLAFGGTRTVHRMTVALEDAGWVIRDMLVWAYASGFQSRAPVSSLHTSQSYGLRNP